MFRRVSLVRHVYVVGMNVEHSRQRVPTVTGTPYVGFFFNWLYCVTSYTDRKFTIIPNHRPVSAVSADSCVATYQTRLPEI